MRAEALKAAPHAQIFEQTERLGTAHAVLAAREAIAAHEGDVVVLYADTPLIEASTVKRLIGVLETGSSIAVLGFEARDPGAYGGCSPTRTGRCSPFAKPRTQRRVNSPSGSATRG